MSRQSATLLLVALTLSACTTIPGPVAPAAPASPSTSVVPEVPATPGGQITQEAPTDTGVDGIACAGTIANAVPGLTEAPNTPLIAMSQRPSGGGYLCAAKSYMVTQPVRLYRLIDSTQPYSKLGGFWSFERPAGSRDDYRAQFAICKQWSQLDRLIACDVRPGSMVVVGTTQSADCGNGFSFPKTGANQVFVPNDGLAGIVHTGGCVDQGAWPPASN